MRWNHYSNASDALGLGPRAAGQLATVGIRTVAELLAANTEMAAMRLSKSTMTVEVLAEWQNEAALVLQLPELPSEAARFFAAAGIGSAERAKILTPTELLAALESAQKRSEGWLAKIALPSVGAISEWITLAQNTEKLRAA